MGLLKNIRRHAAVAAGDFAALFRDCEIPPLPAATARLLAEIKQPEPDIGRLVKVISASPELSAKVLRTINSSLFALRNRVTTVQHAVTMLGVRHIRTLALSYAVKESIPRPESELFDHEAFWSDSLLRALFARGFAQRNGRNEAEEAFTAMLLADVALPVLLSSWQDYYQPVVERWREGDEHLSVLEREAFGWDHSQAGAWILQSWDFPEELVCFVGTHNLAHEEIGELGLGETIAIPMATAAMLPSVLNPDPARAQRFIELTCEAFSHSEEDLLALLDRTETELAEVRELFELKRQDGSATLAALRSALGGRLSDATA